MHNLCTAYAQPVENLWITCPGGAGGGLMLSVIIVVATDAQNKSKLGKLR
jgi:hypothetical protein